MRRTPGNAAGLVLTRRRVVDYCRLATGRCPVLPGQAR